MRKKDITTLMAGMALGTALTGGAAAAGVLAEPSWSPIYVDGQQVQMTAYNIAGSNFVKLRDIGQAVGFNVYYQNGVQVDSDASYTGEAPISVQARPAQTTPAESVRISCYKDGPLMAGDSSALIIYPSGIEYTVTSSDPSVVTVEKALDKLWKANAIGPGTATITAAAPDGRSNSVVVTVTAGSQQKSTDDGWTRDPSIDLTANQDIRQEMVRLINQTRRENGVGELTVNESLMNAAQDCSAQMFRKHHSRYECEAAMAYGYPHGFGDNLTWFYGSEYLKNVAQTAVNNWIKSPGHFQAMIDPNCDTLGVGVTIKEGAACCYMFAGDPNSHHPYE